MARAENNIRRNEVSANVALLSLTKDEAHYTSPVSKVHAARVWRQLAANVGTRNQDVAEQAYVIKAFVVDCIEEGWSEYTLDRAAVAWRRSNERFMPTFGQLRACVKEAGQKGGPSQFREMHDMLITHSSHKTEVAKDKSGADGMDLQELQAFILRLEKGKASGSYVGPSGKTFRFMPTDAMMLAVLKTRLARLKEVAA